MAAVPEWIRTPRPRARRRHLPWFARYVLSIGVAGALVAVVSTVGIVSLRDMSEVASTGEPSPIVLSPLAVRSFIYDRNGGEIAVLYADEDREEIALENVPKAVQDAVLEVEDRDFYEHHGVNVRSTFRAVFANLEAGDIEQGGSTITQQLIKNSIVGGEQTVQRKAREAVLAWQLEDQMSKQDILERYLNSVYLGNGTYGVQAFAETYYNLSTEQLGWEHAALLAALIRNPVGYDPIRYPKLAGERRDLVVDTMRRGGLIDDAEAERIKATPLPTKLFSRAKATSSAQLAGANYFSETVKQQLLDMPELGTSANDRYDAVFKGGLRVTTTYDPAAQKLAEDAVATLPDSDGKFAAALATVEPGSGAVRALVGGTDFAESQFNNATQGWRQPGSSFKFFTLMAAFDDGVVPNDTISGSSPCRFTDPGSPGGVYEAKNSGKGGKTSSITSQTTSSSNCAFLRLAQYVGLDKVAAMAQAMEVTTLNPEVDADGKPVLGAGGTQRAVEGPMPSNVLSMPIGSKEVHPLQMAAAYATAANDGVYHRPFFIEKVTDAEGKVLYEHRDDGTQVVSAQTARLVTEVLAKNATSGTGRKAALDDQPSAGKTGTTQENADVWYVGYTPYLATAVWIGNPKNRDPVRIGGRTQFGADYPARIWNAFMEPYHAGLEVKEFTEPVDGRKGKSLKVTTEAKSRRSSTSTRRRTSTTTPATSPPATAPPQSSPPASGGGDEGG